MNPILNAIDAVADSAEKEIYIQTRRTNVGKLPKEQRAYFKKLRYSLKHPIIRVLIRDTGCGIQPENMSRITEEGFSTKHGSTGYGLSFVDSKIKEIHGTYRIKSKVGQGTDFYLYFPAF